MDKVKTPKQLVRDAAPDLLAACKLAIALIDPIHDAADGDVDMDRCVEALYDAVAKAEGKKL